MPGFNVAPMPNLPPELLAKMAQGSFRPPPAMGMPPMMMPQQQQGFNVQDGMDAVSAGLGAFRPRGGGLNPTGMPEDQGLAGAVAGINALQPGANGQFAQPPMPTDIGQGQGGGLGIMDFLTGMWRQKTGLTGPLGAPGGRMGSTYG